MHDSNTLLRPGEILSSYNQINNQFVIKHLLGKHVRELKLPFSFWKN